MKRFCEIEYGSELFEQAVELCRLLVHPYTARRPAIAHDRHFCVRMGRCVIAYVRASRQPHGEYLLWDFCVAENHRAQGTGRYLLTATINQLAEDSTPEFVVFSSLPMVDFFRSLGFSPKGTFFDLHSLPHIQLVLTRAEAGLSLL